MLNNTGYKIPPCLTPLLTPNEDDKKPPHCTYRPIEMNTNIPRDDEDKSGVVC